jgi:hypothetical protein
MTENLFVAGAPAVKRQTHAVYPIRGSKLEMVPPILDLFQYL